jgi:DNA-binding NarL/FixJ family response regulator
MKKEKIHLAIVDDENLFLQGILLLLNNVAHLQIDITASNGQEFLSMLQEMEKTELPDIAIVDIQMQPMDGFELVELLKNNYPDLKIIVLSSHYKSNVVGHMIKLGVSAFVPKASEKKQLVRTIESVYEYGVFFTQEDHQLLISHMNSKPNKPTFSFNETLSDREIDVLKLICKELTNQEIADQLFLSKRTVEGHRQRILEKVGAKNTVGLIVYAIAMGIHPLPPL